MIWTLPVSLSTGTGRAGAVVLDQRAQTWAVGFRIAPRPSTSVQSSDSPLMTFYSQRLTLGRQSSQGHLSHEAGGKADKWP